MLCFIMNVSMFSCVYILCFPILCLPLFSFVYPTKVSQGMAFCILQAGPLNWLTWSPLDGEWVGKYEMAHVGT